MLIMGSTTMGSLACPLCCGEHFANKQELRYHLLSYADNVYCSGCSKCYDSLNSFIDHLSSPCEKQELDASDRESDFEMKLVWGSGDESGLSDSRKSDIDSMELDPAEAVSSVKSEECTKKQSLSGKDMDGVTFKDSLKVAVETNQEKYLLPIIKQEPNATEVPEENSSLKNEVDTSFALASEVSNGVVAKNIDAIGTSNFANTNWVLEELSVKENSVFGKTDSPLPIASTSDGVFESVVVKEEWVNDIASREEVQEYSCSFCQTTFTSVEDHIQTYHQQQDVLVQLNTEEPLEGDDQSKDGIVSDLLSKNATRNGTEELFIQGENDATVPVPPNRSNSSASEDITAVKGAVESVIEKLCKPNQFTYESKVVPIEHFWEDSNSFRSKVIVQTLAHNWQGIDEYTSTATMMTGPDGFCTKQVYTCDKCAIPFTLRNNFLKHKCLALRLQNCVNEQNKERQDGRITEASVQMQENFRISEERGRDYNVSNAEEIKNDVNITEVSKEQANVTIREDNNGHVSIIEENKQQIYDISEIEGRLIKLSDFPAFECKVCKTFFPTTHTLATHLCRVCKECGLTFGLSECLVKHVATVHNSNGLSQVENSRMVTPEDPITCTVCGTVFPTNESYKMHRKMHSSKFVEQYRVKNGEFVCDVCGIHCLTQKTLKQHMIVHYPVLQNVMIKKRSNLPGGLICKICKKSFESNEVLANHEKEHELVTKEEVTQQTFTCDICNKIFDVLSDLNAHRLSHITDPNHKQSSSDVHAQALPYACGFCTKRFLYAHRKVKHERIHTGEKPYACSKCDKKFRVAQTLNLHMRRHIGILPYRCEICYKYFAAKPTYEMHLTKHSNVRLHSCSICLQAFKSCELLTDHRNVHTMSFTCKQCPRRFSSSFLADKHVKLHSGALHGGVGFECKDCGAVYGRESMLGQHVKKVHTGNESDNSELSTLNT